ncbi:MAG: formate dehydrogenase subunit alpha [Chloroflexota bacterium]
MAGLAASFGSGAMTNSIPEFETDTNCFLIIGSNTSEGHPLIATRLLKAQKRGAKVIVLDPRKNQIGHWADIFYTFRPGSDVAIFNALMNVIISEGLHDQAFIAERTEDYEALRLLVIDYTPEKVAELSGIPAEGIREIARTYAKSKPAAILYAMGITQHTTGVDNVKSTSNLAMLCGNMGVPGGGVNPLRGQNNVQGACDMGGLPNVFPGYQAVTSPETIEKFAKGWGLDHGPQTTDDSSSSVVNGLSSKVGMTVTEMLHAAQEGKVRALYVMGENPMVSDPDLNHVRHCLEQTEFLVVQDIFLTETAQLAHVVLPGASFAEKDGTFSNTERRVQRVRQAIKPVGEAKEDWLIICELARKMGASGFDFQSAKAIMEEINKLTPSYGGITYERLEELGSLQWPCPTMDHPGTQYLHKGKFSRGLGKFFALDFKEPNEAPNAEYPFTLTTGRLMFHFHTGSMTRRSSKLDSEVPEAYIEINVDDAKKIGLNGHKRVRVSSRRGQIELNVRKTDDIKRGIVFIPFHFAEAAANTLTNSAIDPVAKIPEYKVCAVKVEVV